MRCIGRTDRFQRCRRDGAPLVCHQHRFQPALAILFLLSTAGAIVGFSRDLLEPWQRTQPDSVTPLAQESIRLQREAIARTQRAKVVFQGVTDVPLTYDAVARVVFTNIGQLPAIETQGQVFVGTANMLPPEGALEGSKAVRSAVLSKTVVSPGNLVEMPVALHVSETHIREIREGRTWLLLFGYVTYDDGFGIERRTRFCQFYDQSNGHWGNCPANNSFE